MEDGYLSFKAYASGCETADLVELLNAQMRIAAGKLLPDDSFYNLQATSIDGTRWVAERVRPVMDGRVPWGHDHHQQFPNWTTDYGDNWGQ